jgi:hypothetical protein
VASPVSSRQQSKTSNKRKKRKVVKVKVPQLSTVRPPGADLDVGNLTLNDKPLTAKLKQAIVDGSLEQSIEGASTFTLTIADWYEALLRSNLIMGASTLTFDGISFTLVKTSRLAQSQLKLTFEETAVNLLRRYNTAKKANRKTTTRAQFVQSMVKEVKQAVIPFKCPEVSVIQPIAGQKIKATPKGKSHHKTAGKGLLKTGLKAA